MTTTLTTADPWSSTKLRKQTYFEYVRDSGFRDEIGSSPFNVIQFSDELVQGGETISFQLLDRLKHAGVSGDTPLQGHEEPAEKYAHKVTPEFFRHAMMISKKQDHISEYGLYKKFQPLLKDWCTNLLRSSIIDALLMAESGKTLFKPQNGLSTHIDYFDSKYVVNEKYENKHFDNHHSGVNVEASEAEKDKWNTVNKSRVFYGGEAANYSKDFSSSLKAIKKKTGRFTVSKLVAIKKKMKMADPAFKPIRSGRDGREFYKVYAGSDAFGDLKQDDVMVKANREARSRDIETNPLFQDGDLIYDGMIVREIPELPVITKGGADCDVSPVLFCGAQAVAYAQGQAMKFTSNKNDDYGFMKSRGVEEYFGITKMQKNGLDHGVFTLFVAVDPNAATI